MEKISLYEHRVSYYETDQMGIVHHSNYIRWFEDARVDFLEKVGFSYAKMEEIGIMIVVLGASWRALRAFFWAELRLIRGNLRRFGVSGVLEVV